VGERRVEYGPYLHVGNRDDGGYDYLDLQRGTLNMKKIVTVFAFLLLLCGNVLLAQADGTIQPPSPPPPPLPNSVFNETTPTGLSTVPLWSSSLGRGFTFQISSPEQIASVNTVALRDLYNGVWLLGYGHELAYFYRNGDQIAYIDAWNAFNTGDVKGVFGMSAGVHPVAAFYHTAGAVLGDASSLGAHLPPWAANISQWSSIEFGAGYRFFDNPTGKDGTHRFAYIIGGEVNVPIGRLWGVYGSL
jgi:hypothetical protein